MTTTEPNETFQIPIEVAEAYESLFVPAFFAQWAPILCDAAGLGAGHRVLDVACGTGIVARTAAPRVEPGGRVVGVDLNEAMLTVARRTGPGIDWRRGDVSDLPFPDRSFDVVLSQMALMFFPDRRGALAEMGRVAAAGGAVGIAVPDHLAAQAAFAPFVDLAARLAGPQALSLLSTYFSCGDLDELSTLVESAGLEVTGARSCPGLYRAPSVDAMVRTEVESTPLRALLSDEVYGRIRADAHAHEVLGQFVTPRGSVEAPFSTNVVVARRP